MKKKKHLFRKVVALTIMGAILVAGNASAAKQNTYSFDKDLDTTSRVLCQGSVGTGANIATQEIKSRVLQFMDAKMYCDVYFVHQNRNTGKYVTVGVWIRSLFGKCNSKYLTTSGVKKNTPLRTYSKTKKNPYSGATTTSIEGTVKY